MYFTIYFLTSILFQLIVILYSLANLSELKTCIRTLWQNQLDEATLPCTKKRREFLEGEELIGTFVLYHKEKSISNFC